MKTLFRERSYRTALRRLLTPLLAVVLMAPFAAYELAKPAAAAKTAVTTSTAAPLDNESIAPLLALDRAMETVAERVTPALVNVAVTARSEKAENVGDMQDFFGQFFGQGRMR